MKFFFAAAAIALVPVSVCADDPTDAPLTIGDWRRTEQISLFTDQLDVYARTKSIQPLYCGSYEGPENAVLEIRCKENTTALIISTNCHLASGFGSYGRVEFRVDDRPAFTRNMIESTSNDALGLWRGGQSIPVIKNELLVDGDMLVVRFTPFGQSPVVTHFSLDGLDEQVAVVRHHCHW